MPNLLIRFLNFFRTAFGRAILVTIIGVLVIVTYDMVFHGGWVWLINHTPTNVQQSSNNLYTFSATAFRTPFVNEPSINVNLIVQKAYKTDGTMQVVNERWPMSFVGAGDWRFNYLAECDIALDYFFEVEYLGGILGEQHTVRQPSEAQSILRVSIDRSAISSPIVGISIDKIDLGNYQAKLCAHLLGGDGCFQQALNENDITWTLHPSSTYNWGFLNNIQKGSCVTIVHTEGNIVCPISIKAEYQGFCKGLNFCTVAHPGDPVMASELVNCTF